MGTVLLIALGIARAASFVDAATAEIGNHSLALPFGQLGRFDPLYPAVHVGAEHRWVGAGPVALVQDLQLGGFHHAVFGTTLDLTTDVIGRLTLGPVVTQVGLGVGGFVTWRSREVLSWDEAIGSYAATGDPGRPGLSLGVPIGLGLDLSELAGVPVTPMLIYRWFIQTPFLPVLPAGPQGILGVGVRVDL